MEGCCSRGKNICKDPVEGRQGKHEAPRAHEGGRSRDGGGEGRRCRQKLDHTGPGRQDSGVWPLLGPPPYWQQQWGRWAHSPQNHFYLLCFGFNLSVGESFQKDPWVDP